jgi:hypothetical protein
MSTAAKELEAVVLYLPRPVVPDMAALRQGFPLRVVAVVDLGVGGKVDVLAEVEAAPICLTT